MQSESGRGRVRQSEAEERMFQAAACFFMVCSARTISGGVVKSQSLECKQGVPTSCLREM